MVTAGDRMPNAAALAAVAARYRLQLGAARYRGGFGSHRGSGVGSSQDFLDFRDYAPGDDLRHLDWRGYARTEKLRVRLYQEEVAPFVDVAVDTSASLAVTPGKERAVRSLVGALRHWGASAGVGVRCAALGGGPLDENSLAFDDKATAPALPLVPLRPRGVRVLVTDGLWADDPAPLLHRMMATAVRFVCLQVLDPWELQPEAVGAVAMVDAETGERRELQLDRGTIVAYRQRLQRLCDALRGAVLAGGGVHVQVPADELATMCARDLLPAGVVEPA